MNEMDLLIVFHDVMKRLGATNDHVFVDIDETMLSLMRHKFGQHIQMKDLHQLADNCIANEWLERTTADPYYHALSLTDNGLDAVLKHENKN